MELKQRAYVETTVVSYLTAKPSQNALLSFKQEITRSWWSGSRSRLDLFVSELVWTEASRGDVEAVARRSEFLKEFSVLSITDTVRMLARALIEDRIVPHNFPEDALHISIAAVHNMDYLVTWNCRHIANAFLRPRIETACALLGLRMPIICTPEELQEIQP